MSVAVQLYGSTVAATMQRLTKIIDSLKNVQGTSALRRVLVRRILGLTLIVAGLSMLMSGIETVLFH